MPQVEVKPYVRSDGVRVEGYVRSLPYNSSVSAYAQTHKTKSGKRQFQAAGRLRSDLGEASFRHKSGKFEYTIEPNVVGIATAGVEFALEQYQKAKEAPGTVADAATQGGQDTTTTAAVMGGGGATTIAAPVLLAGAATPAAMSAGAAGTALVPVATATVAKGGAIALIPQAPGATTMAGAMSLAGIPSSSAARQVGQQVVKMAGSRSKFKIIDGRGKTLMSGLTRKQAEQMAAQFGIIL
jgi:cytoskeletal protein RodZ